MWQRNILNKLNIPWVANIGNHDCVGNGRESYSLLFGPTNYSLVAGRVKFLFLNTNALEYDYGEAVPDLDFVASEFTSREDEWDRCVVTMHARPGADVFNNNVKGPFHYYITQLKGLMFCLNGHYHNIEAADLMGDGIIYYQSASIEKRKYYIFTITPNGYSYEVVDF